MKHIFTIHSPITYLCAASVINHLRIEESNVIILSSGYKIPFSIGMVYSSFANVNSSLINKIKNWNLPAAHDAYISEVTNNDDFIAYIDIMHYWQRILVTHKKCQSFNFIEEGTASYMKPDSLAMLSHIAKTNRFRSNGFKEYFTGLLFASKKYNDRLYSLPYWPLSYRFVEKIKFYCFSEYCYPGVPNEKKEVVYFQSDAIQSETYPDNSLFWIEDSYSKTNNIKKYIVTQALEQCLDKLNSESLNISQHYVKLRPNQNEQQSEIIPFLKSKGISFNIINDSYPLELKLLNTNDAVLIGCTSSLLFYGGMMGHRSMSYYKLLDKPDGSYDNLSVFWKFVQLVDN